MLERGQRLSVRLADLNQAVDQTAVVELIDHYARQPTGQGRPLDKQVRQRLAAALASHPSCRVFLGHLAEQPVALACCFLTLSTFRAKPLLNVHDLVVHSSVRGRGYGEQLLRAVIDYALQIGCCAVTLEVRGDNRAKRLYERVGFSFEDGPQHAPVYFGRLDLQPVATDS